MTAIRRDGDDLILACYLQPRAGRDEIVGEHDGELKIRIQAPPVDGAANARLVRFLAKAFGVAKSAVVLESGDTGRHKRVRVSRPVTLPPAVRSLLPSD